MSPGSRWMAAAVLLVGASWGAARVAAENWPAFRGPRGNGVSGEGQAPLHWKVGSDGQGEGVVWRVPLPRPGNGSPIVVDGRVYLASAEDEQGKRRGLLCFDAADGRALWSQYVEYDQPDPTHETNPYCGSTPACDGKRVVVWHGSAGLHCYDTNGQLIWKRELGEYRHVWGYGTSPVIHDGRVLMHCGPGANVSMQCLSLEDGSTLWKVEEPVEGDGSTNDAKKYQGSWSTPVLVELDGKLQAVCTMPTRLVGYEFETGKVLWYCEGIRGPRGDLAYSSPLIGEGVAVASGGYQGPAIGVKLGGEGNITDAARLWRREQNPQNIGSGIMLGEHAFIANAGPGTLQCLRAATGDVVWEGRASGNIWGSIVLAGGNLYATNQQGETIVFEPNPAEFKVVATNSVGEPTNSTPAVSEGRLYFRTHKHLVCIGQR